MSAKFVPPRVPLVDLRTGTITREWYLLLQGLFNFSGGLDDESIGLIAPVATSALDYVLVEIDGIKAEAALAPPPSPVSAFSDDVTPPVVPIFFSADDVLPMVGALRDEIAMLRSMIDELRLGGSGL